MAGEYDEYGRGITSPPDDGFAIVESDIADLPREIRAINVAVTGPVRVLTSKGNDLTVFIAAGIQFPLVCKKVFASGTTATGLVGLF